MIRAHERILVAGPSITNREVELTAEAARTAWYGNHYTYNSRFEKLVADYVGVAHAVSLPHCTAALHLSLCALGIGTGDEVIVPDVTWIASVAPVTYVGATPVLVDIDPLTWCIDAEAVERAVGPRTRAVIGVNLYGSMCDWDRLQRIADLHGLALIEDAAESLGSRIGRRRSGSFGRASAFSFHGSKTVVTGEGGMLATNETELYERVLVLRDHGRPPGDRLFLNSEIAFKYRMSAVQAALGVAQMERIDELIARKRQIFNWYRDRLGCDTRVKLNTEPDGTYNSFWMVTIIPDPALRLDKFAIIAELDRRNIDSRPFFSQLSSLPAFDHLPQSKRFLSDRDNGIHVSTSGVNLPSGYHMDEEKVDIVCNALREILD